MIEIITPSLDDHEEVVFVADNVSLTSISSTQPRTDIQDNIQDNDINVIPLTPDPLAPSLLPSPLSYVFTGNHHC